MRKRFDEKKKLDTDNLKIILDASIEANDTDEVIIDKLYEIYQYECLLTVFSWAQDYIYGD